MDGGMKANAIASGISSVSPVQAIDDRSRVESSAPFVPGLESDEVEAVVGAVTRVSRLKPAIALNACSPSVFGRIASTLRQTRRCAAGMPRPGAGR